MNHSRSRTRKQWDRKGRTTQSDLDKARDKMHQIKKTVLEKEAELAAKKLDTINKDLEKEKEKEMAERRKARSRARKEK